ncbi:hypothetical protein [Desulforhopalus singaporensis]|uniref:Uncharacterized protein n=1 Tax=Desulforhopalus singaporensis TaxID=91360 RepID=A0A1H0MU45_9BACT|nr:hypothetical protein [Desulforhopalus singaporensis]SDO83988.1 hypothetical protein SAMN05660330_01189 [Desulforhopalus singaporensis]
METIAVYWEEQIKVYGISDKFDLMLSTLTFDPSELEFWGQQIAALEAGIKRFEFIACHRGEEVISLHLLLDKGSAKTLDEAVNRLAATRSLHCRKTWPVDLIYLHGPHFQDRFGIADAAATSLARHNLTPLITGCAGTSMYLVFRGGEGDRAKKTLTRTFLTPMDRQRS